MKKLSIPPTVIQLPCYLEVVTHLVEEEFLLYALVCTSFPEKRPQY